MKGLQTNINSMVTDHGLNLPADITEEQHLEVGKLIANIEKSTQWAKGDWYNTIPGQTNQYDDNIEGKKAACKRAGLNYNSAKQCGGVCEKYRMGARAPLLTFNHHKEIAFATKLTDEQRNDLLLRAENGDKGERPWSTRKLIEERDKVLGTWIEPPTDITADEITAFVEKAIGDIPERYKTRVTNAGRNLGKRLSKEYNMAVIKASAEGAKEEREKYVEAKHVVDEKLKRLAIANQTVTQIMTKTEFKLVRACLHPDRHGGDEKYGKAFQIFNRMLKNVDPSLYDAWNE